MEYQFKKVSIKNTINGEVYEDWAADINDGKGLRSLIIIDNINLSDKDTKKHGLNAELDFTLIEGADPSEDMISYLLKDMIKQASLATQIGEIGNDKQH